MKVDNKRKYNYKKIGIFIGIIVIVLIGLTTVFNNETKDNNDNATKYIAGNKKVVLVYNVDFSDSEELIRGTKVKFLNKKITDEEKGTFEKIEYDKKIYLITQENLVNKKEEVVLENTLYVRTPVTVYSDSDSSKITSMIKKGEEVEILGFTEIDEFGNVIKYNIRYGDLEGYIYGKYLVDTKEEALLNYAEDESYQIHAKRGDTQGGGSAANLDFYPYPKGAFTDNIMPDEVRSLYMNTGVIGNVDEYIKLAKENNMNAIVVDIKDNTSPGYSSPVMAEYSPTNFKRANNSIEKYKAAIQKIKDAGLYVIGRITVFKDSYFVQDHPESAIADVETNKPYLHNNSYWPSAFNRKVWEFNVELAKEAVQEMGFNEIQFDYVRFPDRLYGLEKEGKINLKNDYGEEKAQAIQGFLMYATDELHNLGVYVSADVFGEAAHNYVTGYGQYWGAISNVVDVISPMPYPDHFNAYEYGFDEIVWTVPYDLLKFWGENYVQKRQSEIPTPAVVRTWIQAYNAIRPPYIEYDAKKVEEQIRGLYEAGLTGGYMPWNAGSSLNKFRDLSPAFKIDYLGGNE